MLGIVLDRVYSIFFSINVFFRILMPITQPITHPIIIALIDNAKSYFIFLFKGE